MKCRAYGAAGRVVPDYDAAILRDELSMLLRLAVNRAKLNPTQRAALRAFLLDVSLADAGREAGLTRGALWMALNGNSGANALHKLRRTLATFGFPNYRSVARNFLEGGG